MYSVKIYTYFDFNVSFPYNKEKKKKQQKQKLVVSLGTKVADVLQTTKL